MMAEASIMYGGKMFKKLLGAMRKMKKLNPFLFFKKSDLANEIARGNRRAAFKHDGMASRDILKGKLMARALWREDATG